MELVTYGITFDHDHVPTKHFLFMDLYYRVLRGDEWWFFALHPYGATLRCGIPFEKRVTRFLTQRKIKFKRDTHYYDPKKHEYYGVHIFGEDMVRVFHALSILIILYSPRVALYPSLERLGHMLVNMSGIHDFARESDYYLRLAEGRRKIIGQSLPLPKWVYRLWARISSRWFTHEK